MNKKKIITTVIVLVVCLALLIYSSYAWLVLSRAPSITGMDTHIGANGNLEIALLSDNTYMNPSLIRSSVGDSATVQETVVSNITWGNLIDLSDESYGLHKIFMYPSRLNLSIGGTNEGIVSSNMFMVPKFSIDGRINHFEDNTVSAVYNKEAFTYYAEQQRYGVRGIGTISSMPVHQSALAGARTLVKSYNSASLNATESTLKANGAKLLKLYIDHYALHKNEYSQSDVAVIRDTATRLLTAVGYVDSAIRQGIVGFGATVISDEETFKTFKTTVANPVVPLSMIVNSIPATLPKGFGEWINTVEADKKTLKQIILYCDKLKSETITWAQISSQLLQIINPDKAFINKSAISEFDTISKLTGDNQLTIAPNSGIMSNIADFNGNYNVVFEYENGKHFKALTTSTVAPSNLKMISDLLEKCEAATGTNISGAVDLRDIYGYAVDMAFRCNADANLLLQTASDVRVDGNGENVQAQGQGSYMKFSSEKLEKEQIVFLMDAMRIGFMDNQNNLLAIAKLNTSNYSVEGNEYRAPLYLYDYSVSTDGSMSIGQRRDKDTVITNLSEDVPTIVTAVVWLDGDHVDNSIVASNINSMSGSINLQFASDTELNAAAISVDEK